jgi:hypothetical protein
MVLAIAKPQDRKGHSKEMLIVLKAAGKGDRPQFQLNQRLYADDSIPNNCFFSLSGAA